MFSQIQCTILAWVWLCMKMAEQLNPSCPRGFPFLEFKIEKERDDVVTLNNDGFPIPRKYSQGECMEWVRIKNETFFFIANK